MIDDEISECPLDGPSSEDGGAANSGRAAGELDNGKANVAVKTGKDVKACSATSSNVTVASGAVPKTSSGGVSKVPRPLVQILGCPRPGLKDQSQGAHPANRSHRSAVRPFFCCGSELSLVSLMDGVDLNASACSSGANRLSRRERKLSLSDSEETAEHLLPHSCTYATDLAAVCGSRASVQTVCGTGTASGGSLVPRMKSRDEQKAKKSFWGLSFRKKLPGSGKLSEMRKSACGECGSKKCSSGKRLSSCGLVCEKGKVCSCQKASYQCTVNKRKGHVVDRRASVSGIPINGNEELLAGERSRERARANSNVESLLRLSGNMDETSLARLTSRLNQSSPMTELVPSDSYPEWPPLSELQEELAQAFVHTRIDFIHHLVPDLKKITNCSFYWGVIDRYEAERLLDKKREGTFLLRDSAQDDFLFSVSFRRYNRSLHARIEQWNHRFSFDVHDPAVYSAESVCGLIEHYKDSSRCLFFEPMLTDPLHRSFTFTLQHLARAAICSNLRRYDDIGRLPLPVSLKAYLRYYHYKQKVCVRTFEESPHG